jgi:hypothetical protein
VGFFEKVNTVGGESNKSETGRRYASGDILTEILLDSIFKEKIMKVVSKTVHLGEDAYVRINADGTYSALAFGSFRPNQIGLCYDWIPIPEKSLSVDIIELLKQ